MLDEYYCCYPHLVHHHEMSPCLAQFPEHHTLLMRHASQSWIGLSPRIANRACPHLDQESYYAAPELIRQVHCLARLLLSLELDVVVEFSEFVVILPFVFLALDALLQRLGRFSLLGGGFSVGAFFSDPTLGNAIEV